MNAPVDVTNIRIETERLLLRPWSASDLEDLYEYASIPGIGEMAGWTHHKSKEESKTVLSMFIKNKRTFALELKENGKVIGSLGLEEGASGKLDECLIGRKLGYVLHPDYWGRGYMPEAVNAIIQYCFGVLCYDYMLCGCFDRNSRSRRVMEKCGFCYLEAFDQTVSTGNLEHIKRYAIFNPRKVS